MSLWSCIMAMMLVGLVSARQAKWFFSPNTVTHFVNAKQVTSSCVVIEESLRPCRHLRQLHPSQPSAIPKVMITASPALPAGLPRPPLLDGSIAESSSARSWGPLLQFGGEVTVTQTITQRSLPPPPLVTFSVRGCRPSHLPFDLPLCPNNTATTNVSTHAKTSTKAVHFVDDNIS